MKIRWIIVLFVILAVSAAGCKKQVDEKQEPAEKPTIAEETSTMEEEIKAKAKPVVQHFFDALKSKDFEGMRKDFTDKMLEALPAKTFEDDSTEELAKYGEMVSWDYAGWMREGGFDIVLVHVKYAKGDTIQYKFVFHKGPDGKKISGLWKKPLPKAISSDETDTLLNRYSEIMENHLKAVETNDFEGARKDFSQEMLDGLSAETLQQTLADPEIGNLKSWKFDFAKREGEFVSLCYQATFSEGETLAYKFVFNPENKDQKIEGLWLRPLGAE